MSSANLTVRKVCEKYIEARSNILSPSTIRGYRSIQRTRLLTLQDKKLKHLDKAIIQRAVNAEAKLVSAKTLSSSWRFMSAAIYEETGARFNISLPQIVYKPHSFLSAEQIKIFLEKIAGNKAEIPALLALHSLRRSEILALTIENIDFEKGIIKVNGAKVLNEYNCYVKKKENKNTSSRRHVPIIIPRLLDLLHNAKQNNEDLVKLCPDNIYQSINRVCEKNGLPKVGIHGLRHSFASLTYHLQIPEKIAMQIGGWTNDQTMRKIYTHISSEDVAKNAEKLKNFFT